MSTAMRDVFVFWGIYLGFMLFRTLYMKAVSGIYDRKIQWNDIVTLPLGMQAEWPYSHGHFIASLWAKMMNEGLIEQDKTHGFIYKGQGVQEVEGFGQLRFNGLKKKGNKTPICLEDLFSVLSCNAVEIQRQTAKDLKNDGVFKRFKETVDTEIGLLRLPLMLLFLSAWAVGLNHLLIAPMPNSLFISVMLSLGVCCILESIWNFRLRKAVEKEKSEKIRKNLESVEYMQKKKNVPTLLSWNMKVSRVHQAEYGFVDVNLHTYLALSNLMHTEASDHGSFAPLAPSHNSADFGAPMFKTGHSFGGESFTTSHQSNHHSGHDSSCGSSGHSGGGSDSGGGCSGGGGCGGGGD